MADTKQPPAIRERRATAEVTAEQLYNEGQGLEQALAYAQHSGDSEAVSAAQSALSAHQSRKPTTAEQDVVVVGTANIDQNSAMTPVPEPEVSTEDAAYPQGASQAPDLVFVPDPAAHTAAVQAASAEKAAADKASTTSSSSTSKS